MQFKILFIEAIETDHDYIFPGIACAYLASALRREFGEDNVEIRVTPKDFAFHLDDFKPDFVGISAMTACYDIAREAAREAKKRGLPTIIGGVHISTCPQTLDQHMDVGVMGEGEYILPALIKHYFKHDGWKKDELGEIPGVVYHGEDGKPVLTKDNPLITELDNLALPDRLVLPASKDPYMLSSRGCPYKCSFCSSTFYWNKIRYFSPEYTVREIEHVLDTLHPDHFWFLDDLFVAHFKRLKEVARLMRERGLHNRCSYTVGGVRTNHVNEELLDVLASMNVVSIAYGIESGCEKTIKYLKGPQAKIEDNIRAIELARKRGFNVYGYIIYGCPDETNEDIEITYNFVKKYMKDQFKLSLLTPLPGTPLWEECKRNGSVSDNMQWGVLANNFVHNFDKAIIVSKNLSRQELADWYERFTKLRRYRAFQESSKKKILNSLRQVKRGFRLAGRRLQLATQKMFL
ncbi:MAG: radical SAM protein [bacterium]